jgi:hypothetical protein
MESASSVGMGNAKTALADDENTIFQNPAGLAGIENTSFSLSGALTKYLWKGGTHTADSGDFLSTAYGVSYINKNYGFNIYVRAQGDVLNKTFSDNGEAVDSLIYEYQLAGAYGIDLLSNISIGVNVKYNHVISKISDVNNTLLFGAGVLFEITKEFKMGVNIHDVGGINFNRYHIWDDYGREMQSDILPWDIDLGISIKIFDNLTAAFDIKNIIGGYFDLPKGVPAYAGYFQPVIANTISYNFGLVYCVSDSITLLSGIIIREEPQDFFYYTYNASDSFKMIQKTIVSVGLEWQVENWMFNLTLNDDFREVGDVKMPLSYYLTIRLNI